MEVVICPSADEVARLAAAKVSRVCRDVGPHVVIGVATGSSPLALYQALADLVAEGKLDLSRASAFALDEYVGLPPGHPESYATVINRTVTVPLRMDPTRVHTPNGFSDDIEAAAKAYEEAIVSAGGVDVQILGVGSNGHIGFNEPGSSLASRTRIKTLTPTTREDNARFFDSLAARQVVLVAQGEGKADAVRAIVEGPITAMWPGSVLQLHQYATILVDEAAAAKLEHADYYRFTYDNKPAWQRYLAGL
jgi:glucosamine-6-phosphate deaminase